MREIKFRAWHETYGLSASFRLGAALITFNDCSAYYKLANLIENLKFMQYTGLKDKNGKEIYEGYIVKIGECTIGAEEGDEEFWANESIHKIEYGGEEGYPAFDLVPFIDCDCNGLSYYIEGGKGEEYRQVFGMAEISLKVIGNMCETPELFNNRCAVKR